jgi:hypothetical protein
LVSQGVDHKKIAERCMVVPETVNVWLRTPEFNERVNRFVELQITDITQHAETKAELQKAMPIIIRWITTMIESGGQDIEVERRISLAFQLMDRAGVLDQSRLPLPEPQTGGLTIAVDARKQVMAAGDAALAAELERFRVHPVDIPKLGTNGFKEEL